MEKTSKDKEKMHMPVLVKEVVEGLDLLNKKNVVDCTLGLGGHTKALLENLPKRAKVVAFDADKENLKAAKKILKDFDDRVIFINANFALLQDELRQLKMKKVDAILADLGLSSVHVDDPDKGFSFLREGPLDMRFDKTQELTAAYVINKYSEKELIRIFKEYGEEPHARKIAMEIAKKRKRKPFKTTTGVADFVEKLFPRKGHIHPATRIFQAIRMEVNHELDVLQQLLTQAVEVLQPGGRIAVIAYHSLEDRLVKNFFRAASKSFVNLPNQLTTTSLEPTLKILTKKPIVPTEAEMKQNPRSRSAKLRIAEKL